MLAAAHDQGIGRRAAERVIGLLAAAGALHDFPAATLRALPDGPRARLAGELATVSLAHGYADGGALVLARRQAASVRVHGAGPVAASLASLLTASGVGRVSVTGAAAGPPGGEPAGPGLGRSGAGPGPGLACLADPRAGSGSATHGRVRLGPPAGRPARRPGRPRGGVRTWPCSPTATRPNCRAPWWPARSRT